MLCNSQCLGLISMLNLFFILLCLFFFLFIGRYSRTTVTCKSLIRAHTRNCPRNLLLPNQKQQDLSLFLYGFLHFWLQIVVSAAHCETGEVHPWNKPNNSEGGVLLYFLLFFFPFREKKLCITFFYLSLPKNSFLLTLPSCSLFSPYQDPHLFLFSSLPTSPSQPTVFQLAFGRKPNVNTSSYFFSTFSTSYLSQDKPSLMFSVLTKDNLSTTLMASFRESSQTVLRILLLQLSYSSSSPTFNF